MRQPLCSLNSESIVRQILCSLILCGDVQENNVLVPVLEPREWWILGMEGPGNNIHYF